MRSDSRLRCAAMIVGLSFLGRAAAAPQFDYVLLHGLNSKAIEMNDIARELKKSGLARRIYNQNYNTRDQGIAEQATQLENSVEWDPEANGGKGGPVPGGQKFKGDFPFILVGHSMGGLRARYYAQFVRPGNPNMRGIVTLGTPHSGAPIISGGANLISRLEADLRLASNGGLTKATQLFLGTSSFGESNLVNFLYSRPPGIHDLTPNSAFLQKINNTPPGCRWQSSVQGDHTQWFQVCPAKTTAGDHPIPPQVKIASLMGNNNDIADLAPGFRTGQKVMSKLAGTWASLLWSQSWLTGKSVPAAHAASDLKYVADNVDSVWANVVVGSVQSDLVVPLASQSALSSNPNITGKNGSVTQYYVTHISKKSNTSETENSEVFKFIRDFSLSLETK